MIAKTPNLAQVLKDNGYSVTRPRQLIFDVLLSTGPVSMAELCKRVSSVDRVSVYRTVDLFEVLGIVNRLQMGWKYKLELSDLFTEHHHHATCSRCGDVVPLSKNEVLEAGIEALARAVNFSIQNHSLEIVGYCSRCGADGEVAS